MDCVIINRVSDRKQKEGYSLDAQDRLSTAYAKEHGFNVIKKYTFQETASKHTQRKMFQEMLSFVESYPEKKTLALIAEKSDRLGRNHTDKEIIQKLYLLGRIEVHFYKDRTVFTKSSTATDIFIDDIMTSVGKYAALNIARESIKGMQEKCEQGWYPAKAPLGYQNIIDSEATGSKKRKILVPDPRTRSLVHRIYELRSNNQSYQAIWLKCIEEGLVPQGVLKAQSCVEKVLKNPFYGGRFFWRGKWYDGKHEVIIPRHIFEKVQTTFNEYGTPWRHKRALFSNWLKCNCGCKVTFDPKKTIIKKTGEHKEHLYYRCANGKHTHDKLVYVKEESMLGDLSKAVSEITITDNLAKDISNALNETHRRVTEARKREIAGYQAALTALENKEDEIYDDFRRSLLDEGGYKRQIERVREERRRMTDLMATAQGMIDDAYLETAKKILELAKMAKPLWDMRTKEQKRDFLERILSNRVLDGVTVRYELKKPFQTLSEMASSSTVLSGTKFTVYSGHTAYRLIHNSIPIVYVEAKWILSRFKHIVFIIKISERMVHKIDLPYSAIYFF